MQPKLLGLVRVWNLEESAVADEPAVRQRQHLCGGATSACTPAGAARRPPPARGPCSRETAFLAPRAGCGAQVPRGASEEPVTCSLSPPDPGPSVLKDLSPGVRVWGAVWGPKPAVATPRG